MPQRNISVVREGITAGVIGATAVAVWFLIVDTIAGHPFYTPTVLGEAVFGFFGPPAGETSAMHVIGYTFVHYAAFIALGTLLAFIVRRAEVDTGVLAGLLLLFVIFEVGFYGATALLSQWGRLGDLAWYQVGAANLLAAGLMGNYIWRGHPALKQQFAYALGGDER
ncbi:MAG: hypothetical protein ABIS29_06575 [Vicinamibacterales bacterium]